MLLKFLHDLHGIEIFLALHKSPLIIIEVLELKQLSSPVYNM